MVWNELKKIWNIRVLLPILVVGGAIFYFSVIGQMNLNHLPLFETVEATLGAKLQKKYGNELDATELDKVKELFYQAEQDLNVKLFDQFPELRDYELNSYTELMEYFQNSSEEEQETDKYKKVEEIYWSINDTLGWKIETYNYYDYLMQSSSFQDQCESQMNRFKIKQDNSPLKVAFLNRLSELKKRNSISTIPQTVITNLGFVMMEFSRVVMLITLLLVVLNVAMENHSRVFPILAVTREGRGVIRKRVTAMLLSVIVLLVVSDFVYFITYRIMLPYQSFDHCAALLPSYLRWFDFTLEQYFFVYLLLINLVAVALAMIVFFVSSYCRTIIGTITAAIPFWGFGEFMSICFFNNLFYMGYKDGTIHNYILGDKKYMPFIIVALLLLFGIALILVLYHKRKVQDIHE